MVLHRWYDNLNNAYVCFHSIWCTPLKTDMEPDNHLFEKKIIWPEPPWLWVQNVSFRGGGGVAILWCLSNTTSRVQVTIPPGCLGTWGCWMGRKHTGVWRCLKRLQMSANWIRSMHRNDVVEFWMVLTTKVHDWNATRAYSCLSKYTQFNSLWEQWLAAHIWYIHTACFWQPGCFYSQHHTYIFSKKSPTGPTERTPSLSI